MNTDNLQFEQLTDKTWVWIHQTPIGSFWRAPRSYKTKQAARKAGEQWLARRADPRNHGR